MSRAGPILMAALAVAACGPGDRTPAPPRQASAPQSDVPLVRPEELAVLEAPDRAAWQQPERVMDALGIGEASRVADLGAGSGWFTARLAHRVGPNGEVWAEDIQPEWIDYLTRRIAREGFENVHPVLGTADDPHLPAGLNAILIVNAFPQFADPVAVLAAAAGSLAPNGRLGVVDFRNDGSGGPGPPESDRVSREDVERAGQAAGLVVQSRETFLQYQFMVVFRRP